MTQLKIIDGDGHIFEDGEAIARHFPYRAAARPPQEQCISHPKPYPVLIDPNPSWLIRHGRRRSL